MFFDCKMIVNELNITNNRLKISAVISCPFDENASSPKVKLVFQSNGKTRRLPLPVLNYYQQAQSGYCIVACSHTFFLENLFYEEEITDDITVRIDFYYGENSIEAVPFTLGSCVVTDEESGLTMNGESSIITISSSAITAPELTFAEKSKVIIPLVRGVFLITKSILCVLLLPYLVLDAVFAALGVLKNRPSKTRVEDCLWQKIRLQLKLNFSSFLKTSATWHNLFRTLRMPLVSVCKAYYSLLCKKPVVPNRITFMSDRRDDLSGNFKFVYDLIKDRDDIDFKFLLFSDPSGHNKIKYVLKFLRLYASSRVVVVDDYFRLLNTMPKRSDTVLYQLWHACGAFKTFGFTRLNKKGGPKQISKNHRMYDYAIVSSRRIAKHYAEGFGLSDECVIATGIPRTDVFMDENHAAEVKEQFYEKHPQLQGKKILLFAPTFRGNGQMSAYYPTDVFHPEALYEALGGQYAIIIKLHPFCRDRFEIPEQYRDFIIDLSEDDELNDLLFVTDLLVTDYSSVIFEASLLDIPMLFYAYDLDEYISKRDFYYDYKSFVPGKIVYSEDELTQAIINGDFDYNKVNAFKAEFFDNLDGLSSQRVADHIINSMMDNTQSIR